MRKYLLVFSIVLSALVLVGVGCGGNASNNENNIGQNEDGAGYPPAHTSSTTPDQMQIKVFNVVATDFSFSPNKITVNQGDRVKINLKSTQDTHNLVISQYNVKTNTIKKGQISSVEFVASKQGSFQYYCSIPGHKEHGMVGTFVVQ